MATSYSLHPLLRVSPLPTEREVTARAQEIKAHGLKELIVLYQGKIIKGYVSYLACKRLKIEPRFVVVTTLRDPKAFLAAARPCRLRENKPRSTGVERSQQAFSGVNADSKETALEASAASGHPDAAATPVDLAVRANSPKVPVTISAQVVSSLLRAHEIGTALSRVQTKGFLGQVRMLAMEIGFRPAARALGLSESRVLNWAWRYGWSDSRFSSPYGVGRRAGREGLCPRCGQAVVKS